MKQDLTAQTNVQIFLKSPSFGNVSQSVGYNFCFTEQPQHRHGGHANFIVPLSSLAHISAAGKQEVRHRLRRHTVRT